MFMIYGSPELTRLCFICKNEDFIWTAGSTRTIARKITFIKDIMNGKTKHIPVKDKISNKEINLLLFHLTLATRFEHFLLNRFS